MGISWAPDGCTAWRPPASPSGPEHGAAAPARMSYSPALLALSLLIAIVAATAALWAVLRLHGVPSALGASLIMGVAVSGIHYTGMAPMHVFRAPGSAGMSMGGATAFGFLLPLAARIAIVTFILIATIGMPLTADEIEEAIGRHPAARERGAGRRHDPEATA
jgi:hypothetical protein